MSLGFFCLWSSTVSIPFPSSSLAFNHLDIKRRLPSVLVSLVNTFFKTRPTGKSQSRKLPKKYCIFSYKLRDSILLSTKIKKSTKMVEN